MINHRCQMILRALELSLVFALVDKNPRKRPEDNRGTWAIVTAVTADNAELYAWPIDLEQGAHHPDRRRAGDDERRL